MSKKDEPVTWGNVNAMRRSHQWIIRRGKTPNECNACGDGKDSVIRYCPGEVDA